MINWEEVVESHSSGLDKNEQKILKNTAKAANLFGNIIFTKSLDMIIEACRDQYNNQKLKMVDPKTQELLPGFQQLDWITFFEIDEVKQKRTTIQQSMLNFNKSAIITDTANQGDIKDLKEIVGVQNKSSEKQQQYFVYTNVESLFENYKEPMTHTCPNCKHEFLCEKTFKALK